VRHLGNLREMPPATAAFFVGGFDRNLMPPEISTAAVINSSD
jgi:hypothetical protein